MKDTQLTLSHSSPTLVNVKLTLHLSTGFTFTLTTQGIFYFLKYQLAISLAFAQQSHTITSFFLSLYCHMYCKKETCPYKVDYSFRLQLRNTKQ